MPSLCLGPDVFGRAGLFSYISGPVLRFEYAELRDAIDFQDVRCFGAPLLLPMLLCESVFVCACADLSCALDVDERDALGLLSALPSKGPGAIESIRFLMASPPLIEGLNGANKGLGSAYRGGYDNSNKSRGCGFALRGVALLVGNGGKAQSIFEGRSGERGASDRETAVVALRFIVDGDFGRTDAGDGERDLDSP